MDYLGKMGSGMTDMASDPMGYLNKTKMGTDAMTAGLMSKIGIPSGLQRTIMPDMGKPFPGTGSSPGSPMPGLPPAPPMPFGRPTSLADFLMMRRR